MISFDLAVTSSSSHTDRGTTRWRSIHQDENPKKNSVTMWDEYQMLSFIVASWLKRAPWVAFKGEVRLDVLPQLTLDWKKCFFHNLEHEIPERLREVLLNFAPSRRLTGEASDETVVRKVEEEWIPRLNAVQKIGLNDVGLNDAETLRTTIDELRKTIAEHEMLIETQAKELSAGNPFLNHR